jgi:hypothetical protein
MNDQNTPPTPTPIATQRVEDFESTYANNVQFQPSVWDLKILFGELDQGEGKAAIEQHTAITIPWATAKLMRYYLDLNISFYESENGRIKIPPRVLPPEPDPLPQELENDPQAKAASELVRKMRNEFIASVT